MILVGTATTTRLSCLLRDGYTTRVLPLSNNAKGIFMARELLGVFGTEEGKINLQKLVAGIKEAGEKAEKEREVKANQQEE